MKVHLTKKPGNSSPRRNAYTLVEVMVATLLLGIMMAVFFTGFSQGYLNLNTTRQDLRATQILTQKTEAVRLCVWSDLTNLPPTFTDAYTSSSSSTNSGNTTYYGKITVGDATNIPDSVSYYSTIKLVTISVTWTNYNRNLPMVHTRQMQTLASKDGMVNYIFGYTP